MPERQDQVRVYHKNTVSKLQVIANQVKQANHDARIEKAERARAKNQQFRLEKHVKRIQRRLKRITETLLGTDPMDRSDILNREAFIIAGDSSFSDTEKVEIIENAAETTGMKASTVEKALGKPFQSGKLRTYDSSNHVNSSSGDDYVNYQPSLAEFRCELNKRGHNRKDHRITAKVHTAMLKLAYAHGDIAQDRYALHPDELQGSFSIRQIAQHSGISNPTTQAHIRVLIELGVVHKWKPANQADVSEWSLAPLFHVRGVWGEAPSDAVEASNAELIHLKGTSPMGCISSGEAVKTAPVTVNPVVVKTGWKHLRRSGKYVREGMGSRGEVFIELLATRGGMTAAQLSVATGYSPQVVRESMRRAVAHLPGWFRVHKVGRTSVYELVVEGESGFAMAVEAMCEADGSWMVNEITEAAFEEERGKFKAFKEKMLRVHGPDFDVNALCLRLKPVTA